MIIAVGHTRERMDHLLSLIPTIFPVFKVYNGSNPRADELHVENNHRGRDIAMMAAGLKAIRWKYAAFVNDDMVHIDSRFWTMDGEIVGCANLSSWIDYDKCRTEAELRLHRSRGREPKFIRTSAFKMSGALFRELWKQAECSAQRFEKLTLSTNAKVTFVPPGWLVDRNVEPFI